MSEWRKPVTAGEIEDGKIYFIAMPPVSHVGVWLYYSELKNGKRQFTKKPGIALRYDGNQELRDEMAMAGREKFCCIEVPKNADKRWRARR